MTQLEGCSVKGTLESGRPPLLLGEIHRNVAAHRMSDHRPLLVVGVRLNFPHLLDDELDVGHAVY
jgi:hypothetical protein